MRDKYVYEKWDSTEPDQVAFDKVKSGEWDFERFNAWAIQVRVEEARDAIEYANL